jgi:hypothetical protein
MTPSEKVLHAFCCSYHRDVVVRSFGAVASESYGTYVRVEDRCGTHTTGEIDGRGFTVKERINCP